MTNLENEEDLSSSNFNGESYSTTLPTVTNTFAAIYSNASRKIKKYMPTTY